MATITPLECDPIRRFVREKSPGHLATKPQLNAATNAATSPLVLSATEKKALLAAYLKLKFGKEA